MLILGIVLVVLVGLYFLIKLIPEKEETITVVTEKINEITADEVTWIHFRGGEEELTFTRESSSDPWILAGYEDRNTNTTAMNATLRFLCGITVKTKIEDVSDYADYGFDSPNYVIDFVANGENHTITYGAYNSVTSVYYVMMDSDPAVYAYSDYEGLLFENSTAYFLEEIVEETTTETTEGTTEETTSETEATE